MSRYLAVLVLALGAIPATTSADELVLASGESLQGKIKGGPLVLLTSQGRAEIPFVSIRELHVGENGASRLQLIDGTALEGKLAHESLTLNQGLYDRAVAIADLRSVRWSPPSITVRAGTPIALQLIDSISSSSTAGTPVKYCVASALEIEGQKVVDRLAPAVGQVLGTGGGSNVEGGARLAISAERALAHDGTWIPLRGAFQFQGGFNASLGLLVVGDVAVARSGSDLVAETAIETEISLGSTELSKEQQILKSDCGEYFRFAGMEVIPLEQMQPQRFYAPVPQPFRVSAPFRPYLSGLESRDERAHTLGQMRYLESDGVALPLVRLELSGKRGGKALIKIQTTISVKPSHDRWVTLKYELITDEKVLKSVMISRIDAEERKVTQVVSRFDLTEAEVAALTSAGSPRLRITMTAIDN